MEGLFACHPCRRDSQVSDLRRRLGPGSLPGGQLAWEMVGVGQKQIPPEAPMPPPSKKAALLLLASDGTRSGQLAPGAIAGGLVLEKKSFTHLWDASCSKTQQDIEEPEVSLLKFKGIPGADSLILEDSRINLTNTTATFQAFEKHTEVNGGGLDVKGISSAYPLCDCVASTRTDGNADANKGEQAVRSINKNLTQLFVNVGQKKVSTQEDFNATTIEELIDAACRKAGIKSCDWYATYGGKCLEADKLIAFYPIFKDATVHLTSRLRGGRLYESSVITFEDLMKKNMDKRYCQVTLSPLSQKKNSTESSVTFLSQFSASFIHKILVYVCGIHRKGHSFNGQFSAKDILIINRAIVVFDSNVRSDYNFSEDTCSNDYMALFNILTIYFTDESGLATAKYLKHLLNYLFTCPAKGKSNIEPLMKFITNHPSLTSYMDRIKQCLLLDSMVCRLDANDLVALGDSGTFGNWQPYARQVPALEKVYIYDSLFDKKIHTRRVINADYTDLYFGCLRFSRNYFSHADYQMKLLEAEAAFALVIEDFLPNILQNVANDYTLPADFDKLALLGNPLADSSELLFISDPTEDPQ